MSGRLHSRAKGLKGPKGSGGPQGLKGPKRSKGSKGSKGPTRSSGGRLRGRSRSRSAPSASRKQPAGTTRARAKPRAKPKRTPPSADVRRHRIPLALAALFALAVLATSFPLSTLLSQHRQLSSASAHLHQLQSENRLLAEQERQLNSSAEVDRLARQDYQLVMPGQTLYDVLPPSGKSAGVGVGAATSADPGNQPLVAPANAPDMTPDPGLPQASTPVGAGATGAGATAGGGGATGPAGSAGRSVAGGTGSAPGPSSFWSRVTSTLEFWK